MTAACAASSGIGPTRLAVPASTTPTSWPPTCTNIIMVTPRWISALLTFVSSESRAGMTKALSVPTAIA